VPVVVFYDVNANALQDGDEDAVVPGATVQIQDSSAVTVASTGAATLRAPAGSWTASFNTPPAYYQAGPSVAVTVPVGDGQPVRLPATLPIGKNRPNVYMAFGDSITDGDGSSDEAGYRNRLQAKLDAWFGEGSIENQAIGGTRSNAGAERINDSLASVHPAYTLILYGTNDWNDSRCRNAFPCFTVDSLRRMVRAAKDRHSLPVVSTIIPSNTGYDARVPPARNVWVASMNELIVQMGHEEGAVVADPFTAFMAVPDFHTLMFDHVHPNDAGYDILTQVWFDAITQPFVAATSGAARPLFLPPPGSFPESVPADPADVPRAPRWAETARSPR